MELKDFISQSLKQLFEGVAEASQSATACGGKINPLLDNTRVGASSSGKHAKVYLNDTAAIWIDFDVALTVVENSQLQSGGKLRVAFASVGGEAESSTSTSAISRVKFSIPVQLPESN